MGKVTGFMEYERIEEGYRPPAERLKHYKEFVIALEDTQARQQGARCMDCGTPFCNNGCPVNNIIPDFNDLVYLTQEEKYAAIITDIKEILALPRLARALVDSRGHRRYGSAALECAAAEAIDALLTLGTTPLDRVRAAIAAIPTP